MNERGARRLAASNIDGLGGHSGAQHARAGYTGDLVWSLGTTRIGALLLDGQEVSQQQYSNLWYWALDQGLAGAGLPFNTTGAGAGNFLLPNARGRALFMADGSNIAFRGATGGSSNLVALLRMEPTLNTISMQRFNNTASTNMTANAQNAFAGATTNPAVATNGGVTVVGAGATGTGRNSLPPYFGANLFIVY